MNSEKRDPPRLASRYWDEYSGKQKLLSSFFGKKGAKASKTDVSKSPTLSVPPVSAISSNPLVAPEMRSTGLVTSSDFKPDTSSPIVSLDLPEYSPNPSASPNDPHVSSSLKNGSTSSAPVPTVTSEISTQLKRKKMQADSNYPTQSTKKPKKSVSVPKGKTKGADTAVAQMKLSSFFVGPTVSKDQAPLGDRQDKSPSQPDKADVIDVDALDADALLDGSSDMVSQVLSSSQSSPALSIPGSSQQKNSHAWTTLFARLEPPRCLVHGEPAREFKVNKPGPNKGKAFFICARYVLLLFCYLLKSQKLIENNE